MLARPFRSRARPAIPAGRRVYAIGDVHGEADLLRDLLRRIDEDARARGAMPATLLFIGDVIDRGSASADLLLLLAGLDDPDVVVLKGNHEAVLVDVYRGDEEALAFWLQFGGEATLRGLGIDAPAADGATIARLRDALDERVVDWLDARPLCWAAGDYCFVHAGVRPGVRLKRQSPDDLLWIREPFLSSTRRHEKVVVHGHTVEPGVPPLGGNRIGIDTGAHEHGCLTALGLEGDRQWLIQAVDGRAGPVAG